MDKRVRHILGLSGGKDSTALAILLSHKIPDLEYFFCDTGKELPETYEYLDRIEARLGIRIKKLSAERGFDHWFDIYNGVLPSPQVRWCTKQLKIMPLEEFIGDDIAYSYVGIRADEDRDGYISTRPNIRPVYPYRPANYISTNIRRGTTYDQRQVAAELSQIGVDLPLKQEGYRLVDVTQLLEDYGIGLPKYYSWRTRSGCFFCFFQRKYEWVRLAEEHPDLFEQALQYEENHRDGRQFYWNQGESLRDLLKRKEQIIAEHQKSVERKKLTAPNKPLSEVLEAVLDDEDDDRPCLVCHL
jgi:3'-phosphoadenosine 5'-phosphosulfate sulfotransferase (PAPS reductase)/FAD synthetase